MKNYLIFFVCAAVILPLTLLAQENNSEEAWEQLFNGKDMNDWHVKITGYDLDDNFMNTFKVEDGLLKVSYDGYDEFGGRFGHIFYKNSYSYYKLRVEYRFVGDQAPNGPGWAFRNSGIMIHGQAAETMGKDQDFPISVEVQILGGNGKDERPTGNVCTPGTEIVMDGELKKQHCFNSTSKTYHGDQWVTIELLVLGDSVINHYMEGDVVMSYTKPQIGGGTVSNYREGIKVDGTPLSGGSISLQSESHPVHFRKVELLNLEGCMDKSAKNFKPYYVKAKNSDCIY